MRTSLTFGRDVVWARRVRRMVGLSTAVHAGLFAAAALFGAWMAAHRPAPMMAYSVELTDMPGTGGQLPAGPGKGVMGRSPEAPARAARDASPPAPAAPAKPAAPPAAPAPAPPVAAAPPKPPEPAPPPPKVETPAVKEPPPPPVVAKKVEAKPVETPPVAPKKAEPKVAPKAEPKKVEPKPQPKAEAKPAPKPEPKAEPKPEPKTVAKAEPAKEPAKPAAAPPTAAKPGAATDDYAAAAERFRGRMAAVGSGAGAPGAGVAGGGPGGGVLGEGGDGRGGGQIRSLEYVAYLQRVRNAVQERWASAISRPGLVAAVRFHIAPDGTVSDVRLEQSSGNAVYDQTALAAVQRVGKLPPPPPAYVNDFRVFQVNFRGSEVGGMDG
jgi:TolA protein